VLKSLDFDDSVFSLYRASVRANERVPAAHLQGSSTATFWIVQAGAGHDRLGVGAARQRLLQHSVVQGIGDIDVAAPIRLGSRGSSNSSGDRRDACRESGNAAIAVRLHDVLGLCRTVRVSDDQIRLTDIRHYRYPRFRGLNPRRKGGWELEGRHSGGVSTNVSTLARIRAMV
jgi:hypothetical protein